MLIIKKNLELGAAAQSNPQYGGALLNTKVIFPQETALSELLFETCFLFLVLNKVILYGGIPCALKGFKDLHV